MAKVKIRDNQTGQIIEVDESQLGQYGLSPAAPQPQAQSQTQDSNKFITGRSLEEHSQALQRAKMAGDTNAVKSITDDYDREYKYQQDYGTPKLSTDDKKKNDALAASVNFVNTLEKRYEAGGAGETNLGPLTRVLGVAKSASGALGFNKDINVYNREKAGFAATLKTLTGDTGVLTEQDFKRLAGLVPDTGSTSEEAKALFNDLRQQLAAKFGGEKTETSFNPKEKGIIDLILPNARNIAQDAGAGISANMTEDRRNSANEQGFKMAKQLEDQAASVSDPAKKKALLQEANKIYAGISSGAKEVSSSFSSNVKDNPILRSVLGATEIAGTAEIPGLAMGVKNLITKGPKALMQKVFPSGAAKTARNEIIEEATQAGKTIDSSKIADHFTKWGQTAIRSNPGKEKQIGRIVDSVVNSAKNGTLTPKDAFKMWLDSDNAFSANGVVKTALESKVDAEMRTVLRPLLEQAAPGFDLMTKAMRTGIRNKKILEWLGKGAAGAAVGGVSYAILGKILGQNKD